MYLLFPCPFLIDIILFQFGTFEGDSNSFWYDALISFLGAFLGLLAGYQVYLMSKRNDRFDKLKHISYLSRSIITYIQSQIESCRNLAEAYRNNPTKLTLMRFNPSSDLKRMAERFDQGEFYHAYLKKYKRKEQSYQDFAQLYTHLDYLDIQIDELRRFIEKEFEALTLRKKEYKRHFDESMTKLNVICTHVLATPIIVRGFQQIKNQYANGHTDPENLPYTYQHFITPVKNFIANNALPNRDVTDLMISLNAADDTYEGILLAAKSLTKGLDHFATQLTDGLKGFTTFTNKIRNDYPMNINNALK